MPGVRLLNVIVLFALYLLLPGCSGTGESGDPVSTPVVTPATPVLSGLPPLSQIREVAYSREQQVQIATQFLEINHNNVTDLGFELRFTPEPGGAKSELYAWSVHQFTLPDYTGPLTVSLDWADMTDFSDIWLGVSNWTGNHWEWIKFDQRTMDLIAGLPTLGQLDFINPDDNRLDLAVVVGGPTVRNLRQVSVGELSCSGWSHSAGGLDEDYLWDIAVDELGNTAVVGQTWSYGQGMGDCLILQYSPDGILEWARAWGTANSEEYTAVCFFNDKIYCTGRYDPTGDGYGDVLAQCWDLEGNLESSYHWGSSLDEAAESIYVDARGAFICGNIQIYSEDPPRDDADALLLKLNPGLASVCYNYHWGTVDNWDRAVGIAIPPDLGATDRICILSNEYTGGWFTGEITPRISFSYDIGTGPDRSLRLNYSQSTQGNSIAAGAGSAIYLGGRTIADTPGAVDQGFVSWFDVSQAEPLETSLRTLFSQRPPPVELEITCLRADGDSLYTAGWTGVTEWPDFSINPFLAVFPANLEEDPVCGIWGSDAISNAIQAMAIANQEDPVRWLLAGLCFNANGRLFGEKINWQVGLCSPADEALSYPVCEGTALDIAPGTATDITSSLVKDNGGGGADGFAMSIFPSACVRW